MFHSNFFHSHLFKISYSYSDYLLAKLNYLNGPTVSQNTASNMDTYLYLSALSSASYSPSYSTGSSSSGSSYSRTFSRTQLDYHPGQITNIGIF